MRAGTETSVVGGRRCRSRGRGARPASLGDGVARL